MMVPELPTDLWVDEERGPVPPCPPCRADNHVAHVDLFDLVVDGIDFGVAACGCLCDDENLALAVASEPSC